MADLRVRLTRVALLLGYLRETVPDALRAVAPSVPQFGDHSAQAVTLDSGAGQMSIQNANAGFEVVQPMQATGANLRIGLDARFLRKLASRSPVMRLEMLGPGDPVRVLDDDPRLLRVVMPMRI